MKKLFKCALLCASLGCIVVAGSLNAAPLMGANDDSLLASERRFRCTFLITVTETWPPGSNQYWLHGRIIIPPMFPSGAYSPPGTAGPHSLEDALALANSDWYHSQPCTGHAGGYPSCAVVRFGPDDVPGNIYTGSGVVSCNAKPTSPTL